MRESMGGSIRVELYRTPGELARPLLFPDSSYQQLTTRGARERGSAAAIPLPQSELGENTAGGVDAQPSWFSDQAAARVAVIGEVVRQRQQERRRGSRVPRAWLPARPIAAGAFDEDASETDPNDAERDASEPGATRPDQGDPVEGRPSSVNSDQVEGRSAAGGSVEDEPDAGDPFRGSPVEAELKDWLHAAWLVDRPAWVSPEWYDAPLRPDVRALLALPLGPELITRLNGLDTGPCPADHSGHAHPGLPLLGSTAGFLCACQVLIAAAWEAAKTWLSARAATTLVDFTGAEPVETPMPGRVIRDDAGRPWRPLLVDQSREELAPAMRVSPTAMGNRIQGARTLTGHPRLLSLVESGGCSEWAAKTLLGEVESLPAEAAAWVVNRVVDRMLERHRTGKRPWPSGEIRDCTKRLRLRLPATVKDQAREQAKRDRKVAHRPGNDGMADLIATLPEVDAFRIYRRLTALAVGMDDPDRTRDQLRADLLTDLLLFGAGAAAPQDPADGDVGARTDDSDAEAGDGGAADPARNDAHRPGDPDPDLLAQLLGARRGEIQINVVVTLATLLGLTDDPAEIRGLGPIPADVARELGADAAWRAWVTDTAGTVVATSGSRYTPPESLARLIRAREPRCRMPGCRRPSERSELDHVIHWPKGRTSKRNLGPLCKRHHQMKTHGGWLQWPDQPDFADGPPGGEPAIDRDVGGDRPPPDDDGPPGWTWRTPAGFLIHDEPEAPLGDLPTGGREPSDGDS